MPIWLVVMRKHENAGTSVHDKPQRVITNARTGWIMIVDAGGCEELSVEVEECVLRHLTHMARTLLDGQLSTADEKRSI